MDEASDKNGIMAALAAHPFRPARWLPGPHAQTVWGPLVRKRFGAALRRERWDTPDGDFLDILFSDGRPGAPVVLLLHGLEGTPASFYIPAFARRFRGEGWTLAALMFRSCGGDMNRARRLYHLGETEDPAWAAARLAARYPGSPLFAAGISLGANALLKWLGEGSPVPASLRGAAAISPPFDPARNAPRLEAALGGFYVRHFLRTLIPKALEKERLHPGALDAEAVRRCRTFYDFDTVATARLHGFADAEDYWRRCGCGQFLGGVRVPTLLLCARDDPFMDPEALPSAAAEASPWLYPLFPERGGHVGFVSGPPWRPRHWAEEQTARFFRLLAGRNRGA